MLKLSHFLLRKNNLKSGRDFIFSIKIFSIFFFINIAIHLFFLFYKESFDSLVIYHYQIFGFFQTIASGRPLSSLIFYFLTLIGFNVAKNDLLITLFALSISSLSSFLLFRLFDKRNNFTIQNRILLILSIVLVVNNVFSVEFYYYSFYAWAHLLSLVLVILAVREFNEYSNNHHFRHLLKSFVFLVGSFAFFQAWSALFWPLILIYVKNKKRQKDLLVAFLIYIIVVALDYLFIKFISSLFPFLETERIAKFDFFTNLRELVLSLKWLLYNTSDLLYPGVFILSIVSIALVVIFKSMPDRKKVSLNIIFIILSALFFSLLPQLFLNKIYLCPRSLVVLGSIPGLLILYFLNMVKTNSDKNYFLTLIILPLLVLTFFSFYRVGLGQIKTTYLDNQIVQKWISHIRAYEKNQSIKINSVKIIKSNDSSDCYKTVFCVDTINKKLVNQEMPAVLLLAKVMKRGVDLNFKNINPMIKPLAPLGPDAFIFKLVTDKERIFYLNKFRLQGYDSQINFSGRSAYIIVN